MEVRTKVLQSCEAVNAVGIFRWAQNGYKFKRDRKDIRNVLMAGWSISKEEAHGILTGEIPVTIDPVAETVSFNVPA